MHILWARLGGSMGVETASHDHRPRMAPTVSLPAEAQPLHDALVPAFTRPTLQRRLTLAGSAILTTGCRTVTKRTRTAASRYVFRPAITTSLGPLKLRTDSRRAASSDRDRSEELRASVRHTDARSGYGQEGSTSVPGAR